MEVIDWNYAIATLAIRFIGIFIVLGILQVIMQITGRIFTHIDAVKNAKSERLPGPSDSLTQEQAAAVGMAIYLYEKKK